MNEWIKLTKLYILQLINYMDLISLRNVLAEVLWWDFRKSRIINY